MNEWNHLLFNLNAMTVYRGLLRDKGIAALLALIEEEEGSSQTACEMAGHYAELMDVLQRSGLSLCDYIYHAALYDDNLFARMAAAKKAIPAHLAGAVKHDLRALSELAYLTPQRLKELLYMRMPALRAEINALPEFKTGHHHYFADERDWGNELQSLISFYQENGSGSHAHYQTAAADEEIMRRLFEQCEPWVQEYLCAKLKELWTKEAACACIQK